MPVFLGRFGGLAKVRDDTWCQGPPFCPDCAAANAMPSGTVHVFPAPANVLPMAGHCPGCRCQPSVRLGGDSMPPWGYKVIG